MLRICIPVHNEATTIGVLLWRLRSVFQGFSREYDVVVYDDASTDGTAEVLEPYRSVMPLTVLRNGTHVGYAGSIDALVRHVAADDEYARRDTMVLMQGDFTESPEHLPELVKRFEGGADLVAVHRTVSDATPQDERRLRRWGRWAVKPFLRLPPLADPFTGFRLIRISVLRDLLKAMGSRPVCAGEGWAANVDFALNVTPFARRIENVEFAPRYDVRQRASRRRGWPDVVALFHWARAARRTARPAPGGKPLPDSPRAERTTEPTQVAAPLERGQRAAPSERERDRSERRPRGGDRPDRSSPREQAGAAAPPPAREERQPREARGAREERALRGEDRPAPRSDDRGRKADRPPREPRLPRGEREPVRTTEPVAATAPQAAPVAGPDDELPPRPPLEASVGERMDADAPAAEGAEAEASGEAGAERKARRRRRRSRRARGESRGGEPGDEAPESGDDGGTPDDAAGQDDGGSDDGDGDGGDGDVGGAEAGAEGARRKRRPRRRRRGRRPGSTDGADDASTPPAADPPAA
ncbi:MAG: glycosyltransferase family 2 protein [Gemmatimonadaceae bacterium]|nr:glycosyltransferase family 2 protein [Gemmatimonadaceae bacterium]